MMMMINRLRCVIASVESILSPFIYHDVHSVRVLETTQFCGV